MHIMLNIAKSGSFTFHIIFLITKLNFKSVLKIFIFADKFANDFFNEHWQVFYREMIPETRKQWEPLFRNIVNQFFSQIPFKYLLKKD